MLGNLLSQNISELILISEETGLPNFGLFYGFISKSISAHVFLFEQSPEEFNSKIKNQHNITIHNFYTDPLGWNNDKKQSFKDTVLELIADENAHSITVFIDSVSEMLRQCLNDCGLTYRLIQLLRTNVKQVVLMLHTSQVTENVQVSLQHMADATLHIRTEYQEMKDVISALKYEEGSKSVLICKAVLRKKNGKVSVTKERIFFNEDYFISAKPWAPVLLTNNSTTEFKSDDSDKEITENLTFNLNLSANEKAAKSRLVMPYTQSKLDIKFEEEKSGRIFYEADDVDDFDEEDPDDDLEF